MFKWDYIAALLTDASAAALPSVTGMILSLLASKSVGSMTSIERALMQQAALDAPSDAHRESFASGLQDAMERCGEQSRRWLRNSSLIINCRLLELSLGLQSKPLVNLHGLVM